MKEGSIKKDLGIQLYDLAERLFPICRSITGDGLRETLSIISEYIDIEVKEIPTGTKVYDWEIPLEWNIKNAWIKNPKGDKILDFTESNLHVLNYSYPISKTISLDELREHIFTLPDQPDKIPYKTSYYNKNWGFCMRHDLFESLEEGNYEINIDSTLEPGSLTYGEYYIKGESNDEVIISTHICHPSLCNENLSGIVISTYLAKALSSVNSRYSYRFLFIPTTIGSIAWLSLNKDKIERIKHGLVITLLGDEGKFNYKKSRIGNVEIDKVFEYLLNQTKKDFGLIDFSPYGYDERQFCSPGFNLPFGRLTRALHDQFKEYHNSGDNLDFIKSEKLSESFELIMSAFDLIEANKKYFNLFPFGEPRIGKRLKYDTMVGNIESREYQMTILWILNYSDGKNTLLDIAEKSGVDFYHLNEVANSLCKVGLIQELAS